MMNPFRVLSDIEYITAVLFRAERQFLTRYIGKIKLLHNFMGKFLFFLKIFSKNNSNFLNNML